MTGRENTFRNLPIGDANDGRTVTANNSISKYVKGEVHGRMILRSAGRCNPNRPEHNDPRLIVGTHLLALGV